MDIASVQDDFDNNGITKDLDEIDLLLIECRRKKNVMKVVPSYAELNLTINKVRSTLLTLRPLGRKQHCVFCRKNNEKQEVYSTHVIRNDEGMVTCPILQKYTCPLCGVTGKKAHTMKYCPLNDEVVTVDAVFKTPRTSNGFRICSSRQFNQK